MRVQSVHHRDLPVTAAEIDAVLVTTGQPGCLISPEAGWPPDMRIRLDGPVALGASGGHGQIHYSVEQYDPGKRLLFRVDPGDGGMTGTHGFELAPNVGETRITHTIEGDVVGLERTLWPLIVRFHDAYIECVFDRIEEATTGTVARRTKPPRWMRAFNALDTRRQRWTPADAVVAASAAAVPAALAGIGALHLAWAAGSTWPLSSMDDLASVVMGSSWMPPPWMSAAVGLGLLAAAAAVAAAATTTSRLPSVATSAVAATLVGRGLFGAATSLPRLRRGRYERLDVALYSPLCLALGFGAAAVSRSGTLRRS